MNCCSIDRTGIKLTCNGNEKFVNNSRDFNKIVYIVISNSSISDIKFISKETFQKLEFITITNAPNILCEDVIELEELYFHVDHDYSCYNYTKHCSFNETSMTIVSYCSFT